MDPRRLIPAVVLLGVLCAACGSPGPVASGDPSPSPSPSPSSPQASLSADASSYAPGGIVRLTLRAGQSSEVGYNLCPAYLDLEREVANEWQPVNADLGPTGNTVCTAELRLLQPGASAEGQAHLPKSLAPGTYRIAHDVEIANERTKIATQGFVVAA